MKTLRCSIFFLSIFLMSCSVTNPPTADPLLNKQWKLTSPRLLCQTRTYSWISNHPVDLNVMRKPGNPGMPTLNEYSSQMTEWQTWHERSGNSFRILGLLPTGTMFHFYRIDAEKCQGCLPIFYAVIDSGSFKGTASYYQYDKTDPYDRSLLATLSS